MSKTVAKNKKRQKLVSVVITTKSEEKNVGNCLESIKTQTYPRSDIEIIVVDNNSSDKTKEIAKKYTSNVYNFGPERSAQRNYGVKKAKGRYVIYLDADMILSPSVIEKSVEKLENSDLVALYISEIILGNSYWSKVRRFERSFYDGTVIDCVRIMRKDVFEKVGGFDETLTGPEDWDLDKKIRKIGKTEILGNYDFNDIDKKLCLLSDPNKENKDFFNKLCSLTEKPLIYHNESEFDLRKYLSKKGYYSKSFNKYIEKWSGDDFDIKKQFGFLYRYLIVFTEGEKWIKLATHINLALGICLLRVLVGGVCLISGLK